MEKVKGMTTCKICGRDFLLLVEEHYVSTDVIKTGLVTAISGDNEPQLFDSFDCPHCGCQNIMQPRKRANCPCDYGICDECTEYNKEDEDDA